MWLTYEPMGAGLVVVDDTTVELGRFRVYHSDDFDPALHSRRSISVQSNERIRRTFGAFDEALAWCRSHRMGVKVVREFRLLPEAERMKTDWNFTHYECRVLLRFKKISDAVHFKLRWWP